MSQSGDAQAQPPDIQLPEPNLAEVGSAVDKQNLEIAKKYAKLNDDTKVGLSADSPKYLIT